MSLPSAIRVRPSRRAVVAGFAAATALAWTGGRPRPAGAAPEAPLTKVIPSTGEAVPVVGMGTWITFNVGRDERLRAHRTRILKTFFKAGGRMIDCSPMYGSAADVVGDALARLGRPPNLFSAGKVWTSSTADGPDQMAEQRRRWGVPAFDLMQIHNLRNWEGHLETLRAWKAEGRIRYLGLTTSHGRRHDEMVRILERAPLDFVQVTYNVLDRAVEDRILPLARDRGVAVIANRPYRQKDLFHRFQDKALPAWGAEEADIHTWADFFLKFIVSHPAVTCAIPATSQLPHMAENMAAATGRLPEPKTRARMIRYLEAL